jgi:hypothetical protein
MVVVVEIITPSGPRYTLQSQAIRVNNHHTLYRESIAEMALGQRRLAATAG